MTCEGVAGQAPAALVDAVGQPERDEVGVGRDVRAVELDVVAGVGDHDEVARRHVEHPARELRAAGAAGQDDDRRPGRPSDSPVILIPACTLLRTLIEISSGVSCSVEARHLQTAGVDAAQALDAVDQLHDGVLVGLAVAADQDVLVERVVEVAEQRAR